MSSSTPFILRNSASAGQSGSGAASMLMSASALLLTLCVVIPLLVSWNNENLKTVTAGPGLTVAKSGGNVDVSDDFSTRIYTKSSPGTSGSPCGNAALNIAPFVNATWNFGNTFFTTTPGGGFNGPQWSPPRIGVYYGQMRCIFLQTTIQPPNWLTIVYALTLNGTTANPYAGDTTRIVESGIFPYLPNAGGNQLSSLPITTSFHACPTCQFKVGEPIGIHFYVIPDTRADNIICYWNVCQNS